MTACLAAALLTACEDREDRVDRLQIGASSIEELSIEAQRSANDGRMIEAARLLDEIDRQFPTSPEAPRALILAGRYYFEGREYERATAVLSRFIRDHGGHPDIAYAYYLRGVSSYRSVSDVDKDEGDTDNAAAHLNEVINRFAGTDYALDASVKLNAIKNQRAAKELVTGKFYHHRREYMAALNRYQNVLVDYSDSTYVEEAMYRVIEVYRSLGLNEEARNTAVILGHNFPDSEWYYKAYEIVEGPLPSHIENAGGGFWSNLNPFG
ncbi:MAG: outer membrane protein assembly factor BamD [Alphaproteobacteria bacterium]